MYFPGIAVVSALNRDVAGCKSSFFVPELWIFLRFSGISFTHPGSWSCTLSHRDWSKPGMKAHNNQLLWCCSLQARNCQGSWVRYSCAWKRGYPKMYARTDTHTHIYVYVHIAVYTYYIILYMIDLKWSKFIHNLCPVEPEPFDTVWHRFTHGRPGCSEDVLFHLRVFGHCESTSRWAPWCSMAWWGPRFSIVFHMIPSGKLT